MTSIYFYFINCNDVFTILYIFYIYTKKCLFVKYLYLFSPI